jgi:hypothetical protein
MSCMHGVRRMAGIQWCLTPAAVPSLLTPCKAVPSAHPNPCGGHSAAICRAAAAASAFRFSVPARRPSTLRQAVADNRALQVTACGAFRRKAPRRSAGCTTSRMQESASW